MNRSENGAVMTREIPETIDELKSAITNLIDYFNAGCDISLEQQNEINLLSAELELFAKAIYNINSV
jgi:predicted transcriptional regulator